MVAAQLALGVSSVAHFVVEGPADCVEPGDLYAPLVPVSRKRKKVRKSRAPLTRATQPRTRLDRDEQSKSEFANVLTNLVAHRRHVDTHRVGLAAVAASALVVELVAVARLRPDCDLDDELCARVGVRLREWADGPMEDCVCPNMFAEAIVTAAAGTVRAALQEPNSGEADAWRPAWRVLTAAANIVPFPLSETAADAIKDLRTVPGGRRLPRATGGPRSTGQVLWTRDSYGSRFGVTAAFAMPAGGQRWYLWDIDACGHQALTVHSAYYPTSEQALAAWQAGVGDVAAAGTVFTPVDDASLLAQIMPAEEGFMRAGGENDEQFAEYHRSKRLAEAAIRAVGRTRSPSRSDLDAATAATQFSAWLHAHRADQPQPDDLDELITELADSWQSGDVAALYSACSPHRVALTVLHLRNYYQDDFADQLIALLPDWTCWLTTRDNLAPHLARRCQAYVLGQPHADVGTDDSRPNYLARVIE